MSGDHDLDALAESRLDGDLDDARWRELEAAHGPALIAALARARAVRGAVAAFERPTLPPATRAAILAAAPVAAVRAKPPTAAAAAPLRFPWRVLLPTALAAGLVVAIVATLDDGGSAPDAVVAKRDEAALRRPQVVKTESSAEERSVLALDDEAAALSSPLAAMRQESADADRIAGFQPKPGAAADPAGVELSRHEPLIGAPAPTADAPAEAPSVAARRWTEIEAKAVAEGGSPASGTTSTAPAAIASAAASADSAVPFESLETRGAASAAAVAAPAAAAAAVDEYAALLDQARAFDGASAPAGEVMPPSPLGLALAWVSVDPKAVAGDGERKLSDGARTTAKAAARDEDVAAMEAAPEPAEKAEKAEKASRTLTLTLSNGTVGDVVLPPGSLALHGFDRAGRDIWQSPVRADRATELPGGGTTSWQEIADAPASVVELRLHWGPHRSAPLPIGR